MKTGVWTAAQVKSKAEFSVSNALQAKGYQTFVPTYVNIRQWSDRKKASELPLISGYVFVRMMVEKSQSLVVSTPGVMRMVAFGGQTVPINDSEIERVRAMAESALKTEPWSYMKQGSQVKITRGSLAGMSGTVLRVRDATLLIISIEMLQRSVAVHIDRAWLEPMQD